MASGKQTEALIKEIRDNYTYGMDQFTDIREEGATDMRYASNDPWSDEDKRDRKAYGRPALNSDELSQYINQAINTVRQNPRGMKAEPRNNKATDKTAELHEDILRAIEYDSKAWRGAYLPAFESALQRSYGFWRVSREYDGKSFNQVLRIKGIQNPDSVIYDPDCKESDWSDADFVFVVDPLRKAEFARRFPKAEKKSFTADDMAIAKDWIREDHIVIAEYWKAKYKTRNLVQLQDGTELFEDELPGNDFRDLIVQEREYEERSIVKYITNGVEILEETPEPEGCRIIPIIAVIGKEMFVDRGSGNKRELLSMIRFARDPQMLLCYLVSQEAEEAKLTPKVPYVGYKGQFESDAVAWKQLTDQPRAFVQVDAMTDSAGGAVLPLPRREQFTPNFQQYEIAKDGARRAIQAAMGITPLPTAAQRRNEKSGKALDKIQEMETVGSHHFVDNLDRALELTGACIEERLAKVYDTRRALPVHKADGRRVMIQANTAEPYQNEETGEQEQFPVDQGDHIITLTTGPSHQSQRQAASDFLDALISNMQTLPADPQTKAKLLSLAIQMKQLGPLGDEMAEIISPPEEGKLPPQAMQAVQQSQAQVHAYDALVKELQQKIQELELREKGKVIDNQFRLKIDEMEQAVKVLVAEITTKAQKESERETLFAELQQFLAGQAHERAMQAVQHQHEANQADAAQQAAQAAQEQQPQQNQQAQA